MLASGAHRSLQLQAGVAEEVAAGRVTVEQVAQMGVGTNCWVYWPYLKEARICGASTQHKKVGLEWSSDLTVIASCPSGC